MRKSGQYYLIYRIVIVLIILIMSILIITVNKNYRITNVFMPSKELPIYSVDRNDKKISLSFDAAYGDEYTMDILETLDKHNIKSTFFLVGFWIDKFPHQVKEIHSRGHDIGNHSQNHPNMSQLSIEKMNEEINSVDERIYKLTKVKPNLFRPPYGDYNDTVINVLRENNYYPIQWDVDSLDWKEIGVEAIIDRVMRNITNGSIVLCHNNAKDIDVYLPLLIERLIGQGYEIVPISELIYKDNYYINNSGKQIQNK